MPPCDKVTLLMLTVVLVGTCHGRVPFGIRKKIFPPTRAFSKNEQTPSGHDTRKERAVVCKDELFWKINRGGWQSDDQYDEDYDEEEEEYRHPPPPRDRRRPQPPRYSRPPPPRRGPPRKRPTQQSSALNSAARLAKKSIGLTTAAATTTLKTSGKAAYYLVSPKHVTRPEVWGVWRLDQQVGTAGDGASISCAANVEFTPRGLVVTKYQDETFESTFLFKERSWPKSCMIEFESRAFQGPNDKEPVLMRYKGYFRRKLADSSVIKIVGNIYVVRKGGLWRGGGGGRKVGTFVARRRMMPRQRGEQDDYEQYDSIEDPEEEEDESEYYESDGDAYDDDEEE